MYGLTFDFHIVAQANQQNNGKLNSNIYIQIRKILESKGFEHTQGSVYVTNLGLSTVHKAIEALRTLKFKQFFSNVLVFKHEPDNDFTDIVTK